MKVSELEGALLDYWVAKANGDAAYIGKLGCVLVVDRDPVCIYTPSTDWGQGGPIIEREGIESGKLGTGEYYATKGRVDVFKAKTQLVAAMRCFVASKYGESVPCPDKE